MLDSFIPIFSSIVAIIAIICSYKQTKRHDRVTIVSNALLEKYNRMRDNISLFLALMDTYEYTKLIEQYYKIKLELDMSKEYSNLLSAKLDIIFRILDHSKNQNDIFFQALKLDTELTPNFKETLDKFNVIFQSEDKYKKNEDDINREFKNFNNLVEIYQSIYNNSKDRIETQTGIDEQFNENFNNYINEVNQKLVTFKGKKYLFLNSPFPLKGNDIIRDYFCKEIKINIDLSFTEYLSFLWDDIKKSI
ncbi:MAG: hypothetical protein FWC19_04970 [Treponema sp.]|nr:hypothetical protein [Treponema sp.]MCL2272140.1 hypothetical protein [Treponema sp.]